MSNLQKKKKILMKPQPPRGYPRHYELDTPSGGIAILADEGPHLGAGFGVLFSDCLELYGVRNFHKNGGLAWQCGQHQRIKRPPGTIGILRGKKWWWAIRETTER